MRQLVRDRGRQQARGRIGVEIGLRRIGKKEAGIADIAQKPREQHGLCPHRRSGKAREDLLRALVNSRRAAEDRILIGGKHAVFIALYMLARRICLRCKIFCNRLQLLHGYVAPLQTRLLGEAVGIVQHAPPKAEKGKHRRRYGKDRHACAVSLHPPPPDKLRGQQNEQRDAERREKKDDPLRHGKRHGGKNLSRKSVPRAHERFA